MPNLMVLRNTKRIVTQIAAISIRIRVTCKRPTLEPRPGCVVPRAAIVDPQLDVIYRQQVLLVF